MAEARKTIATVCLQRRKLHFDDLSEVLEDVRRMHAREHRFAGNWTLAQVCKHLANTFHGSIDGLLLGGHRLRRVLLGRRILAWSLKHGIPPGVTLDPRLNPPADCDYVTSFCELERALERYKAHKCRLKPHPIFGRLNRRDWDRLHCFHCAHHLSFIVPEEG
jgi:hypothetical protein